MAYEGLRLEKQGCIVVLTLDRPQQLNALNGALLQSIPRALADAAKDKDVRALIITGSGRGFCSGADISHLAEIKDISVAELQAEMRAPTMAIYDFPAPTIAAINGVAAGAGTSLALACDMRICSDKARFTCGYNRMALMPDLGITYFLPRIIGTGRAIQFLTSGEWLDAAEAVRLGIASQMVPEDKLMGAARELAENVARGSPGAIALTRQAVRVGTSNDLETQINLEAASFHKCLRTEHHKEGLKAFWEKRPPDFGGPPPVAPGK